MAGAEVRPEQQVLSQHSLLTQKAISGDPGWFFKKTAESLRLLNEKINKFVYLSPWEERFV
jgi:hypothetical protein